MNRPCCCSAVEEKRFYPLGRIRKYAVTFSSFAEPTDRWRSWAARGKFREDLLARINLWTFRLPGLAERPEDIEPNLEYELERVTEKTGRQARFNREARELFLSACRAP